MGRPPIPLSAVLVLPAGVLVGHAVGYGTGHADAPSAAAHSHLPTMAATAAVLAVVGLVLAAWRGDAPPRSRLPVLRLAGAQTAAFLLLEAAEHVGVGLSLADLAGSPAVWIGVVAQLGVAAVAVTALGVAAAVPDCAVALPGLVLACQRGRTIAPTPPWSPRPPRAALPAGPRGPPRT